jgi:hypothetical protein
LASGGNPLQLQVLEFLNVYGYQSKENFLSAVTRSRNRSLRETT